MSLIIERVSHAFGGQQALNDVSLRVEPGDCYGFIGHNGAGKTTTMRIMLGLLQPSRGRVIVDGFDAAAYPREARARMGALIETPGFWGHWSGRRNLALLDRLAGGDSDLDGLLELVGLAGAGKKPVRAYSQGMRQRLGVAQALLGEPRYVLLDEPTNGLDPDGIFEMRKLILRLTREEKRTVLLSSHQLRELSGVCNRVGLLRQGRLVLEGTLDELLASDHYVLRTEEGERAVELEGREPAVVLRELVDSGARVESFAPAAPTLEEIYHRELSPPPPAPPSPITEPKERLAPAWPEGRMVMHEVRRWLGQWTVPMLLLLPAITGIVWIYKRHGQMLADHAEMAAGKLATASTVNAFEGVAFALYYGVAVLCYVGAGLASQSLAGELSQGTLRNVLLRPLARFQIGLGKFAAVAGAVLASYLVLAGVAVALSAWYFDFTGVADLLPNGKLFEHVSADEIWPEFWRAVRSPILPLAGYAGVGFLAGALVRGGTAALVLAIAFALSLDVGRLFVSGDKAWLLSSHVPSFDRGSAIGAFADVAQGIANVSTLPGPTAAWLVPIAWILLTLGASLLVFRKRYVP